MLDLKHARELDVDARLLSRLPHCRHREALPWVHRPPWQPESLIAELLDEEETAVGVLADDEREGVQLHGFVVVAVCLPSSNRSVTVVEVCCQNMLVLATDIALGLNVLVVDVEERVVLPQMVLCQPLHSTRSTLQLPPGASVPSDRGGDVREGVRALRHHVRALVVHEHSREPRLCSLGAPHGDESCGRSLLNVRYDLNSCSVGRKVVEEEMAAISCHLLGNVPHLLQSQRLHGVAGVPQECRHLCLKYVLSANDRSRAIDGTFIWLPPHNISQNTSGSTQTFSHWSARLR
mmetsp:Transcript_27263/g.55683  ORF Transcript_27263/g.55683 Transcript_27263/m.55683 type:complete len:292 (+) Transcript_27263:366-1241(+)